MDDLNFLHQSFDQENQSLGAIAPSIVVLEDDPTLGTTIKKYLSKSLGLEVVLFQTGTECLEKITQESFKDPFCLVTDISLENGMDGLAIIDMLKERKLSFTSIVMTGFGSIESAIAATKKGVFHYLTKPFELDMLNNLVLDALGQTFNYKKEAIQNNPIVESSEKMDSTLLGQFKIEKPGPEDQFCGMIGRSSSMKAVFDRIKKVAKADSTVLITGPSGTGKELVTNAIHELSFRSKNKKVSINCGAIPAELLESELFGHVKGSFTGAISNREGKFKSADGGTIFLDEIGDMPSVLQVKLLRVLQNKVIEPVGSSSVEKIDVRVITATHKDLESMVAEGLFREDLFYRLNVIPIKIPALKERREDIPLLISYFLDRFVSADRRNAIDFSPEALELIMTYDWPGNVRELENLIERLVILRGGNQIRPEDLPAKLYRNNPLAVSLYKTIFELPEDGIDLKKTLSEIEDSLILQALNRTEGNKNQASKLLSLNRTTLIEKMKKRDLIHLSPPTY